LAGIVGFQATPFEDTNLYSTACKVPGKCYTGRAGPNNAKLILIISSVV
jgi:hypothetical protein